MKCINLLIICLLFQITLSAGISDTQTLLKWELAYSKTLDSPLSKWIPATVPGAVQLDIARAEKYQPFYYAEHWKDYLWMEDQFYTYRTSFKKPELSSGERLAFVSNGIDYQFKIFLNDKELLSQEGMFTPVRLDLTDYLNADNELRILVYPTPKAHTNSVDRSQAAHSVKPAVSYGWDWHPRLIPLGIWDNTYLEVQSAYHIDDFHVNYTLNEELNKADIRLQMEGRILEGMPFAWTLKDENGKEVLRSEGKTELSFANPQLWWTHDHGQPTLYTSTLQLFNTSGEVIQTLESKIGFRRIRLVMNEGAWREPDGFPKTRSVPPIQLELNGRKIFCKGTNWVNPEIFPGIMTRERYDELLVLAKEANFNILRIWGGGIVNKESFFEICDEKGFLVWWQ